MTATDIVVFTLVIGILLWTALVELPAHARLGRQQPGQRSDRTGHAWCRAWAALFWVGLATWAVWLLHAVRLF